MTKEEFAGKLSDLIGEALAAGIPSEDVIDELELQSQGLEDQEQDQEQEQEE